MASSQKIILNADGSVKLTILGNYIQQGNDGVDEIYIGVVALPSSVSGVANFELPNGDVNTLAGVYQAQISDGQGSSYKGFKFTLTQAQTLYVGDVKMSLQLTDANSNVLYSYSSVLTINPAVMTPSEQQITQAQWNSLVSSLAGYQLQYAQPNVRGYNSLADAQADINNLATNQIILYKYNNEWQIGVYNGTSIVSITTISDKYLPLSGGTLTNGGFNIGKDLWTGNELISSPVNSRILVNDATGEKLIEIYSNGELGVHNVINPTANKDASNKQYVDSEITKIVNGTDPFNALLRKEDAYVNIYDKTTDTLNKSVNATYGTIVDNVYWDASDYVLLLPNTKYYCKEMYLVGLYAFYNMSKEFISVATAGVTITRDTSSDYAGGTIETGSNPVYMRFSISHSHPFPLISRIDIKGYSIKNMFVASTVTANKAINATYGTLVDNQYFDASDFILLEKNTTYYCENMYLLGLYAFYDTDQNFLSLEASMATVEVDSSGSYAGGIIRTGNRKVNFRFSVEHSHPYPVIADVDQAKFLNCNTLDFSYFAPLLTEKVRQNKVEIEKFPYPVSNLLDTSAVQEGKYVNSTYGNLGNMAGRTTTDFIFLESNKTYYISGIWTNLWGLYSSNIESQAEASFVKIESITSDIATFTLDEVNKKIQITMGNTGYYFRGTFPSETLNDVYVSSIAFFKEPYGTLDYSKMCGYLQHQIDSGAVEVFTNKKVLVMGDSISTDYYGNYPKWVTDLINEGFFDGEKVTNSSIHATGFVAEYNNEDNSFLKRIKAIENPETYDLVIVFGGINDYIQSIPFGTADDDSSQYFVPAVNEFFDYLINHFTQARIVVLSPLRTSTTTTNPGGKYQTDYADYIKQVAKSYCLPILNLTEESGFCPFIDEFKEMWTLIPSGSEHGDGVHPNEEYEANYLAPMIKKFLKGLLK